MNLKNLKINISYESNNGINNLKYNFEDLESLNINNWCGKTIVELCKIIRTLNDENDKMKYAIVYTDILKMSKIKKEFQKEMDEKYGL